MKFKAVFYLLGRLLIVMAFVLLVPAFVAYLYQEYSIISLFLWTAVGTAVGGGIVSLLCMKSADEGLASRDGFLLVTLAWLGLSLVGSIPFFTCGYFPTFIDAFFESVSGFTTTGASVLKDIEVLPRSILFWRNFSQWIGGMGIVVFAIAVLPQLSVGGMQLMKNEMPGPTFEQLKPRLKQTAMSLWKIYVLFSIAQVFVLKLCGMNWFDSVCHMFGTMSTGGFSPYNSSLAEASPLIQYVVVFFMFIAGCNFVLHYTNLRGNLGKMFQDAEWRFFSFMILFAVVIIFVNLMWQAHFSFEAALRVSLFQVLTIVTTTGYATSDFDAWPHLSKGLLFLLMFTGACAGSTSGGMKQVRLLILFKKAWQSIVQHIFPKAVVSLKLNKKSVPDSIVQGVSSFFLIYIVIFSFCTLMLLAFDIDFITATSAVVATLSNVGPGFAEVGATQNYASMPDAIKILLSACMIIGRLEIFTVLVLFFPATWRK